MKKTSLFNSTWLLIIAFAISRIIIAFFGVRLDYSALYRYWQYLDVHTLQHNLLRGIWYDHTQPPVFNLLLGVILKLTGALAPVCFTILFKLITLINTFLLFNLLKKLTSHSRLALLISLLYLLSPATMVFENELFYTTFISMLLLAGCHYLLKLQEEITWKNVTGLFLPLVVICLTRSMYHLVWLVFVAISVLVYYKKRAGFKILLAASVLSLLTVGSWYVKNYLIFHSFSTSTWMGMNFTRNVFHDATVKDPSKIESIPPFSPISSYKAFITSDDTVRYAGLNDVDLLQEMKNDSLRNMKHISYIEVSKKYMEANKQHIASHPVEYLKNVVQSAIIFFAPATRYSVTEFQARKIKYYDLVYSSNISHFATGKRERRIALVLSALPQMIIYFLVFLIIGIRSIKSRRISYLNFFIISVIGYTFVISSLVEHYENMRFRFEVTPLFLLLLGSAIAIRLRGKAGSSGTAPAHQELKKD